MYILKKRKRKIVIAVIIASLALLYAAMFISTNSLISEVKNVMLGNVPRSETHGTPISVYNFKYPMSGTALPVTVEVKMTRKFVLHNFFDGCMWIKYTYRIIGNDGGLVSAGIDISARWKIHRENGKWVIVDIKEDP